MLEKGEDLKRIASSLIVLSLFLSLFAFSFNIQVCRASGTIYIRADGSIDPPTANITTSDYVTYTFISSIFNNSIVVERNNIVIDGAGYTIQGAGSASGIDLSSTSNVTVKNTIIRDFKYGIYVHETSKATLIGNNITANNNYGIYLGHRSNSNCISWNSIKANGMGIFGHSSSNNSISGNNVTNSEYGIWFSMGSMNNSVSGNSITANNMAGVRLTSSSMNNIISGNNITANSNGIMLNMVPDNIISGNNIANNQLGILVDFTSVNNTISHNNFVDNTQQAIKMEWPEDTPNLWDDGYPSGGNYWSDYNGSDFYRGSHQNETGSDGIGDTLYIIGANNTDHYPLMKPYPWPSHDIGISGLIDSKTVVGQGFNASINVRVFNYGSTAEAFNVTIRVNMTIVAAFTGIVLASRNFTTLSFTWDAAGLPYGSYTLEANATRVPGETDVFDNAYTTTLKVTIPGDVTGDFYIDIKDATQIGLYWQQLVPPALPNADINGDGIVNIKDATIVGVNWLQHT